MNRIQDQYLERISGLTWEKIVENPGLKTRVTARLLKRILLNNGDSITWNGVSLTLCKRSLGCGVYEISMEKRISK